MSWRNRCPGCGSTQVRNRSPPYSCGNCRLKFNAPLDSTDPEYIPPLRKREGQVKMRKVGGYSVDEDLHRRIVKWLGL